MRKMRTIIIAIVIALAAAGSVVSGVAVHGRLQQERILALRRQALWQDVSSMLARQVRNFDGQVSVIIKDLDTDMEFAYHENDLFPAASLVKIPIMCACFQAAREGKLRLDDTISLTAGARTAGSGIIKTMPVGTVFTVRQLIEIMITESDNSASNLLIGKLGFEYLNRFFKDVGMKNTNLSRRMMDFGSRKRGVENFTTARDIASILQRLYQRRFIDRQTSEACLAMLLKQKVNDRIPAKLPSDAQVAHKTGLGRRVCHDAGIVFTPEGKHLLVCVLTKSKAQTREVKRFIAELALQLYTKYRNFSFS